MHKIILTTQEHHDRVILTLWKEPEKWQLLQQSHPSSLLASYSSYGSFALEKRVFAADKGKKRLDVRNKALQ
jgi:hypothetical protein